MKQETSTSMTMYRQSTKRKPAKSPKQPLEYPLVLCGYGKICTRPVPRGYGEIHTRPVPAGYEYRSLYPYPYPCFRNRSVNNVKLQFLSSKFQEHEFLLGV